MSINLNEAEYQKVLADIESDLEEVLKSEQEELSKALPPEESNGAPEGSPAEEASESPAQEASEAPAEGSDAPPGDESAGAPAPDASASPEGMPGEGAPGGEEDLESKLMNLPEEQLRHLYMAAKQALFARMSQGGAPGAAPAAPPDASASPAGAAPMAPPAGGPPMPPPAMKGEADLAMMKPKSKGEMSSVKANGGPGPGAVKLGKSEEDMKEEDKKTIAELSDKVELMAKALNLVFGQPMRKSIAGLSHLPKNDGSTDKEEVKLTKPQVTEKLKALDYSKLSKSDRSAVNGYYKKYDVTKIAHLLK